MRAFLVLLKYHFEFLEYKKTNICNSWATVSQSNSVIKD